MLEFLLTLGIIGFFLFLVGIVLSVLKVIIAIMIAMWILELLGVGNDTKRKRKK